MSGIMLMLAGAKPAGAALPAIGSSYEGGYYAGQISTSGDGVATHNLVVAPVSSGQSTNKQWKTTLSETTGTYSVIDGPTNSGNMNNASHPAAQFCEGLTIGGYSDWYMPAKDELEICYYNLKPTTQSNSTSYGQNAYSVPKRTSNYTSGTPAQTSASDFKDTGAEDFAANDYWSSTQVSGPYAYAITFTNGSWNNSADKDLGFRVRAVRRVAL